jgi:hypothetical protein
MRLARMFLTLAGLLIASTCYSFDLLSFEMGPIKGPHAGLTPFVSAYSGEIVWMDQQWTDYINKLNVDYYSKQKLYIKRTKLHTYIEKHYRQDDRSDAKQTPISYDQVCQLVYGMTEYPLRHGVNVYWFRGMVQHESGFFTGSTCKSIGSDPIKERNWSYGLGQIEEDTGRQFFRMKGFRHYETRWLRDFPLVNLDVSAQIMGYKIKRYKTYEIALQAYNGGDSGWRDGRSKKYWNIINRIVTRNWPKMKGPERVLRNGSQSNKHAPGGLGNRQVHKSVL